MNEVSKTNAILEINDRSIRKEAYVFSALLGLGVSVITFGLCGRINRKTFNGVVVTPK